MGAASAQQGIVPMLDPNSLAKFVDPLPLPALAKRNGVRADPVNKGRQIPFYRIAMRQAEVKLHRDLPGTRLWTYDGTSPGPTIETRSGEPILVEWVNQLPEKHFLPIDHTLHGAEADKPEVRAIVHLHGGRTPADSDGYPEEWYLPGKSATCYYPNGQEPAALWYHDHAMGITRLNTYAGLFGLYMVRDRVEDELNLPKGRYEIPLVLGDRLLRRDGQLHYPVSGKPDAPWVSEIVANAMLVNGKLSPYLEVEPRKYRFRLLNASNSRFYHLSLSNGKKFQMIGTDQGLLPAPLPMDSFVISPGERFDFVVDFKDHAGADIILNNDAFVMMQLRVSKGKVNDDSALPTALRAVPKTAESEAVRTRNMFIAEHTNKGGESMMMLLNGQHWDMPVTERVTLNSVEIWTIINPTDDSHPIHLHMVRMQIVDRRPYDPETTQMTGKFKFTGPAVPPEPYEAGWKDTIRAHGNMMTRFIVRFEGFVGRYVWHCHLLEHEDNEMMRPYDVIAATE
ncbi:MAG TPA: multicopper oxidase [Bryobacteraceae bacterium]|nr:multicopper oxidase [Bryobacteraceae bacterium]